MLAQQSVRELTLTGRDFPGVIRDVTFLVFQEGWQTGYGADGDHLKSMTDIDAALNAGMPMITLDLTEVMSPGPASWSAGKVDAEFENLPDEVQARVTHTYADRTFQLAASTVHLSQTEARRCALMYLAALDFSQEVDRHLRARRGDDYDLEISIDETTAPTLPAHHLFFASELAFRGVTVSSLAPRFIGEFQKGIDYIGDVKEFERQLTVHCDIAKAFGGYKISVHSGSDKFSVYPSIGRQTGMRLHLKTAGTSWLQAVRVVARVNPALFRAMFAKSLASFPEATRLYHVAADPKAVPDAAGLLGFEARAAARPCRFAPDSPHHLRRAAERPADPRLDLQLSGAERRAALRGGGRAHGKASAAAGSPAARMTFPSRQRAAFMPVFMGRSKYSTALRKQISRTIAPSSL